MIEMLERPQMFCELFTELLVFYFRRGKKRWNMIFIFSAILLIASKIQVSRAFSRQGNIIEMMVYNLLVILLGCWQGTDELAA